MFIVVTASEGWAMKFHGPFETKVEAEVFQEEMCPGGIVAPLEETFDYPEMSGKAYKKFHINRKKKRGPREGYFDVVVAEVNYDVGITIMRGDVKVLCLNRKLYGPGGQLGTYKQYAQKFWETLKVLQSGPVLGEQCFAHIFEPGISGRVSVPCAYSGS